MVTPPDYQSLLVDFFRKGTKLTYEKGEFIVRPGESPSGIYYIESGLVKSYDITKYGEENLLIIKGNGDLLGIIKAITNSDRSVIYATLSDTTVWLQPHEAFLSFVQDNTAAALPLLDMVTNMYRYSSDRVLNLEYRTVRERLISFLLVTARRFGEQLPDGSVLINVPLKHQDIASSISATRETAGRELASLERRDLLTSEASCIILHDVGALEKFLEG